MIARLVATLAALQVLAAPALAAAPAYVVAELVPTDIEAYRRDYAAKVVPVVESYGGRYLARGGAIEGLEGGDPPVRAVVIVFPSVAAARAFWASPAYRPLAEIRRKLATGRIYMVEGLDSAAKP